MKLIFSTRATIVETGIGDDGVHCVTLRIRGKLVSFPATKDDVRAASAHLYEELDIDVELYDNESEDAGG